MLKNATVIFFVLIMLMGNLRFSSMYLYYAIAKEDFVERLCENKDRPELNCDGQCALAKILQADLDEDKEPMPLIGWDELTLFQYHTNDYGFGINTDKESNLFAHIDSYEYHYFTTKDQPPKF